MVTTPRSKVWACLWNVTCGFICRMDLLSTVGVLMHTITKRGLRTVQGIFIFCGSILATFGSSRRVLFHGDAAGSHNARVNARYLPLTIARHLADAGVCITENSPFYLQRQPVRDVFVVIISQQCVCVCARACVRACSGYWLRVQYCRPPATRPRGTSCFSTLPCRFVSRVKPSKMLLAWSPALFIRYWTCSV
jgi:hypothetical protein